MVSHGGMTMLNCLSCANLQKMAKSDFDKLKEHVSFLVDLLEARQLGNHAVTGMAFI